MPDPNASVAIKFAVQNMDDTLAQIGRLHETLGALGVMPSNPWNPALTRQAPEAGTYAGGSAPPLPSAPGLPATPSQQGALASAYQIGQATVQINQVTTLVVQSAGQVIVQGGTAAGGAGSSAASAGNAPSLTQSGFTPAGGPTPAGGAWVGSGVAGAGAPPGMFGGGGGGGMGNAPSPAAPPVSDAGLNRYYQQFASGSTSLDFVSWQQQQFQAFSAGGGQGSYTRYLNTGRGTPGFLDQVDAIFPQLGQLAGPAGMALAAHMAIGEAGAAFHPSMTLRAESAEQRIQDFLQPAASVPLLGGLVQPLMQNLQAMDALRNQGAMGQIAGRGFGQGYSLEDVAMRSGRGPLDALIGGGLAMSPFYWGLEATRGRTPFSPGSAAMNFFGAGGPSVRGMGGAQVMELGSQLRAANPYLSQDDVLAELNDVSAFSDRPEVRRGLVGARASLEGAVVSSTRGAELLRRGSQRLTDGDRQYLASLAVINNDQGMLDTLAQGGRGDFAAAGMARADLVSRRAETDIAGQGAAFIQGEEGRAQATMRGGAAIAAAISQEPGAIGGQISGIDAQLQILQAQPASLDRDRQVNALRLQKQQLETARDSAPYRAEQARFGAASGLAAAASAQGVTALGELQAFGVQPGTRMESAFAEIRTGQGGRAAALRSHLAFLQQSQAGPEVIAQAAAELAQAESQQRQQPLQEIESRFQARAGLAGALTGQAQSALGVAGSVGFYGEGTNPLESRVQAGLQRQVEAATQALDELLRTPGVDQGRLEAAKKTVADAKAGLVMDAANYARQVASDAFSQAQAPGIIAGAAIGGAASIGLAPTPGMQAAQMAAAANTAREARSNAARARAEGRPRDAMMWDEQAAAADAALVALPNQQIQQRFAPVEATTNAQTSIFGTQAAIMRSAGAGSAETFQTEMAGVAVAQRRVSEQQQKLQEMQAVLPQGSALLVEQQAAVAGAQMQERQARAGLGNIALPVEMREAQAQSSYALQVLQTVPGAYGPMRGLLQTQYRQQEQELGYLGSELSRRGPQMSEEERFQIRQRMRQVGVEEAGTIQQLSTGWESRLISQMFGARGNINLDARGFSLMDAVGAGVMNPHMGSRAPTPAFLNMAAGIVQMPGRGGMRGPFSGSDVGVFGMPDLPHFGAGGGESRVQPGAGAGAQGRGAPITIEIHIHEQGGGLRKQTIQVSPDPTQAFGQQRYEFGINPGGQVG